MELAVAAFDCPPRTVGELDGRAALPLLPDCPVPPDPRETVGDEPLLSIPPSFDAAAWSVPRVACAVALVLAPAFSAAVAALSAPLRAVAIASSARPMATWPNTPALPELAPMFSFAATPSRSWLLRAAIRPPSDSTESAFIPTPRPPLTPGEEDPLDDDDDGLPLSPPWFVVEGELSFPLRRAIRRWPAAFRRAGPRRRPSSRSRRSRRSAPGP
ncbi:hypothetical protein [Actinokineospora xionganensis]|uniref:Uncharacterized protein n=1 Tax=Actinokineospora xionganensis TaxID=2684470 RepID=A0ABR7L336_9PSEU|nr:hypothetical protein [Actinokineospora xionganensis]MBC6447107.1 hypothetical protein [Actinokineospora xionganensis]